MSEYREEYTIEEFEAMIPELEMKWEAFLVQFPGALELWHSSDPEAGRLLCDILRRSLP